MSAPCPSPRCADAEFPEVPAEQRSQEESKAEQQHGRAGEPRLCGEIGILRGLPLAGILPQHHLHRREWHLQPGIPGLPWAPQEQSDVSVTGVTSACKSPHSLS